MKAERILRIFKEHMIIKEGNDFVIFGLPFFHLGDADGIALRFSSVNGELVVSDCHTTVDCLEENNV